MICRYEVQERGSLHIHMVLWLHPDDVARVASEIVAVIPADYDHTTKQFIVPTSTALPYQGELFGHVIRRQLHVCKDVFKPGCREKGWCRYGAPWPCHMLHEPRLDPSSKRHIYYRYSIWLH